jgi:hypothetical protein
MPSVDHFGHLAHHHWIGLAVVFGMSLLVVAAGVAAAVSGRKYVDPLKAPKARRVTTPL